MYKLNMGVGFSILQFYYLPHSKKSSLIDIIEQHRIILSEKIIKYYIEKADDFYKDVICTYLDSIMYADDTHVFYESQDEEISAIEEMVRLVRLNPMKVLFGEKEEFSVCNTRKVKLITSQQVLDKEKNAIYKYSFPITNHYVNINENCESYATWFGHLFENENQIEIQDKYILNSNGLVCLKTYYLPYIERGAEINIYCEVNDFCSEADITTEFQNSYYDEWDIHIYLCQHMHDRYIQIGSIQISIGAGLDFLHPSGYTKKTCTLNFTKARDRIPLPTIIKQLK